MTTNEDIRGLEYDWLAVDAEGFVALFSTAGGGYAPEASLQDPGALDAVISTILSLPVTTTATSSEDLPPANTWEMVAERGLFAFDSDYYGGPYRLIAAPDDPITLQELPASVRPIVGRVVLTAVTFKTAREVHEADIKR